jgi:hypothetical protein
MCYCVLKRQEITKISLSLPFRIISKPELVKLAVKFTNFFKNLLHSYVVPFILNLIPLTKTRSHCLNPIPQCWTLYSTTQNKKMQLLTYVSLLLRCSQNFSQKEERCLILSTLVLRVRGNLSLEASSPPSPTSSSGAVRSEGADIPDRRDGDEEIASPPPQRPLKENSLNILSDSSSARMMYYIPVINKFNS